MGGEDHLPLCPGDLEEGEGRFPLFQEEGGEEEEELPLSQGEEEQEGEGEGVLPLFQGEEEGDRGEGEEG